MQNAQLHLVHESGSSTEGAELSGFRVYACSPLTRAGANFSSLGVLSKQVLTKKIKVPVNQPMTHQTYILQEARAVSERPRDATLRTVVENLTVTQGRSSSFETTPMSKPCVSSYYQFTVTVS